MRPVIIVAAYSRAHALSRLLTSIENAKYPSNSIELIISLDGGASAEVLAIAEKFRFSKGSVNIVTRAKNIGLREHILWCGDQSLSHGSVIVLEDDLYVDPYFYFYAEASLQFYKEDENVAGIALYSQQYNEYANLPFEPLFNGCSNYFMQVACSWGQVWSAQQWANFKSWYEHSALEKIQDCTRLPDAVKQWPESSWKKYFSAYLVYKGKFFVYPYMSYSTNCADVGGFHTKILNNTFQVSMADRFRSPDKFVFLKIDESKAKYDAFMEPIDPAGYEYLSVRPDQVEFDFYGLKPIKLLKEKEFCVTSKRCLNAQIKIPLRFKPIEINLLNCNEHEHESVISLCRSKNIIAETYFSERQRRFNLTEYYSGFELNFKAAVVSYTINFLKRMFK